MAVLIAIGGLSGSGKSTLARVLAADRDAAWQRSDVERKAMFGIAETQRLGAEGYAPGVTHEVYERLSALAAAALAQGRDCIVDAVFQRQSERNAIAAVALRAACPFIGLWLDAPQFIRRDRVARRTGDASDATPEIVDAQSARDCGIVTWHRIDASDGPLPVLIRVRGFLVSL